MDCVTSCPIRSVSCASARELGNRLHEHGMKWWDEQLSEYSALPEWHDAAAHWERASSRPARNSRISRSGCSLARACSTRRWQCRDPVDARSVRERSRQHRGVIMNTATARSHGIAEGDRVEIRSQLGVTSARRRWRRACGRTRWSSRAIRSLGDAVRQGSRHAEPEHHRADDAGL